MKCLVAISVSRDWIETDFLMQYAKWPVPEGWQVKFGFFRQFTAAERHNVSMNEAKWNFDRIIYMDTDQVYQQDYLLRMLAHDEPVVTALNVSRYYPFEYTTYQIDGTDMRYGVTVPRIVPMTPPADQKIFECDVTGTGSLMVDTRILDKLPQPFFKDLYDPEGCVRVLPDDFYFGWKLNQAGFKVTVDQTILVQHWAKLAVTPFNRHHLKNAWEAVNSGHGYWKDGKK